MMMPSQKVMVHTSLNKMVRPQYPIPSSPSTRQRERIQNECWELFFYSFHSLQVLKVPSFFSVVQVRDTMQIFLRSLGEGTLFNIVGFGSRAEFLFKQGSVEYNDKNLDVATKHISTLAANLGVTKQTTPFPFFSTNNTFSLQLLTLPLFNKYSGNKYFETSVGNPEEQTGGRISSSIVHPH